MRALTVVRALVALPAMFVVTVVISTAVVVAVFVLRRPPSTGHRLTALWGRFVNWASGVQVKVEGLERIEPGRPYIFAANHQSQFDIFVLQGHFPPEFRWMAKKELFGIPVFGAAMHAVGHVPVDRGHSRAAVRSIDEAATRIAGGTSVVVFPEGTRSRDGRLGPFKLGAMVLAVKSGVPVVPVAILGSRDALPRGAWLPRPARITLRVGEPIPTAGLAVRDKQRLSDRVREALVGLGCEPGENGGLEETAGIG